MSAEDGADYQFEWVLPGEQARVRFAGDFEGRAVLWHMTLYTLACYGRGSVTASGPPAPLRSFMEIRQDETGTFRLEVGLNTPILDEPAIRKTIVMIRNYRRLSWGRREWGEPMAPGPG
ncbi:MAG: hypothetical protein B7Z66_04905 [Chromatiales bacterium 21-64-14]|nr:MAG: hypothetical protein B7Z66_04905 [Chromatiales bacterium 21-64-14]HQU14668.1 hypothetical protein [Gammaproteobacteria bacterium]